MANIVVIGNVLELRDVEEPLWIKEMIKSLNRLFEVGELRGKPKGVLIYNKLPQYLWSVWGDELKRLNITWQDFLKIISKNSDLIVDWAVREAVGWEKLLNGLRESIISQSRVVVRRKSLTLDRFLERY